MPRILIDLSKPIKSERVRAGFPSRWRTVFVYKCPNCHKETKAFASAFYGKYASPGIGAIVCTTCGTKD